MTTSGLPSGRFVLRIAPTLHAHLAESARAAGVSLNEYCVRSLARGEAAADGPWREVVATAVSQLGRALEGVAIFGSFARGEAGPDSDIDVLLATGPSVPIERALYRPWDGVPLRIDGRVVSPHFARLPSPGDAVSGFWAEVALDAAVIYDPELALSRALTGMRRAILAGDLLRRSSGGQSWWSAA